MRVAAGSCVQVFQKCLYLCVCLTLIRRTAVLDVDVKPHALCIRCYGDAVLRAYFWYERFPPSTLWAITVSEALSVLFTVTACRKPCLPIRKRRRYCNLMISVQDAFLLYVYFTDICKNGRVCGLSRASGNSVFCTFFVDKNNLSRYTKNMLES